MATTSSRLFTPPTDMQGSSPLRVGPERPQAPSGTKASHTLKFLLASGGYVIAGPLLILLNNRILTEFPYPIALSALGVGFATVASRLLLLSGVVPFSEQPNVYKAPGVASWRFYMGTALPIGALSGLTLALGNASYVHLSVAMCQMLKALTPAITFALVAAMRIESPSLVEALCVLVITLGTLVATRGDIAISRIGVAVQLGANGAEALRLVLSQQLLANMQLSLFEMQYHTAPPQLIFLLGASALLEMHSESARAAALSAVASTPWPFVLAGLLGLLLQVVGLVAVKLTGSVTFKLLSTARGAALVLFEVLTGGTGGKGGDAPPSVVQLGGYVASLAGFCVYTLARLRGPGAQTPPKKPKAE